MKAVRQGDLLMVEGMALPVMVVSNQAINAAGRAILCPILKTAKAGPLHIPLKNTVLTGYVLCEQLRYADLTARRFHKIGEAQYADVMDIADTVMGMFEGQEK